METTERSSPRRQDSLVPGPLLETGDESRQKRHANLYDAVAGRVTTIDSLGGRSSRGVAATYRLKNATLAPEEVLFQRAGAPQRYAEKDVYFSREAAAVTESGSGRLLPDSDLLKAVHAYAAQLYEAVGQRRGARGPDGLAQQHAEQRNEEQDRDSECFVGSRLVDERSMDETALIAFGILLEEAGREVLGRRGDLVFTEGLEEDGPCPSGQFPGGVEEDGREPPTKEVSVGLVDGETFWRRNYPKRRKRNDDGSGRG